MDYSLMDDFQGEEVTPIEPSPPLHVEFEIKPLYWKKQCRKKHKRGMRVAEGLVLIRVTTEAQIRDILVEVCRTPEAARERGVRPVRLWDVKENFISANQRTYEVDLDSVYEDEDGNKVYKLEKADVERWNKFYIQVRFQFADDSLSPMYYSNEFQLKSHPKPPKNSSNPDSVSAFYNSESNSMDTEDESRPSDSSFHSVTGSDPSDSPHSTTGFSYASFPNYVDGQRHEKVLTTYLEAQKAKIGYLEITDRMHTSKGDIAYHIPLSDPEKYRGKLKEGDIVGLFKDDNERTIIEPLNSTNCKKAVMAGVITRSAYLHAMSPADKGLTDTICVIGIVDVKVRGSVQQGERIYASTDDAGFAVPESHLPLSSVLFKDQTLLGMAMQGAKPNKLDEVNLVQCFVCIVMGITTQQQVKAIEDMYDNIRMDSLVEIKKESKQTRKYFHLLVAVVLILLILLGVFFYQWFYPGSALRYYICKIGSIPGHTAKFKFIPTSQIHQRYVVHGVEFEFEALLRKIGDTDIPRNTNITDAHYYLNVDRCAYGGIRLASQLDKIPQVGGPSIFSTNHNCTEFYFFEDEPLFKWVRYKSPKLFPSHNRCSHTGKS